MKTESESMAESIRDLLLMLSRHGVPVKVPTCDVLEVLPVSVYQSIAEWAVRPDLHEQPEDIRPTVRLVKGGEKG